MGQVAQRQLTNLWLMGSRGWFIGRDVIKLEGSPEITCAPCTSCQARHLCFYRNERHVTPATTSLPHSVLSIRQKDTCALSDFAERMRALPGLSVIFGGHGLRSLESLEKIDEYIAHRWNVQKSPAIRAGEPRQRIVAASIRMFPPRLIRWPTAY